jgi:hypothetical protein
VLEEIGADNVFGNIDDALNRARQHLGIPEAPPPLEATPTVARETPVRGTSIAGTALADDRRN